MRPDYTARNSDQKLLDVGGDVDSVDQVDLGFGNEEAKQNGSKRTHFQL